MISVRFPPALPCALALALMVQAFARAQSTATIEGTVLDPSGAVIPGAKVVLRHTATQETIESQTNELGFYSFQFLRAGTYALECSAAGFARKSFSQIELDVGRTLRINATLDIETPAKLVRIDETENHILVDTTTPVIGGLVSEQHLNDLPLNERQFSELALLVPGTSPPYPNGATQQFNTAALGLGFSVNGQRSERNNYTLDGVTVMEPFAYSLTVNPSVDAIQEFRIQENSYGADQGVTSGAQVTMQTRGGTNRFRGTAYEFLRNSALDARNFFDDPNRPIPGFRQNQFGASAGGPLKRETTFFFANYEALRVHQSVTNRTLLPPPAMRGGDFTGANPLTGLPFPPILDPSTGQQFSASANPADPTFNSLCTSSSPTYSSASNSCANIIPAARFDPMSKAILGLVPPPNQPNAPPGANNNVNVGLHRVASDQFTFRLDHRLKDQDSFFARLIAYNSSQLFPFVPNTFAQNPSAPPGFGTNKDDTGRNLALGATHVFTPVLLNDARLGVQYYHGTKEGQNIASNFLETLGIARAPGATNRGIPAINVPGLADMGDSDIFQPQIRKNTTLQFADTASWVAGRHSVKFGADLRRLRLFYLVEDFGQGIFSFSDGPGSVSGTAFSDLLLGRPFLSFAQAGNSGGNDRLNYAGFFFTDEFRATDRLTLTYGLREEFNTPPVNADGRGSILDPSDSRRFIVRNDRNQAEGLIADPTVAQLQQNFGLEFMTSQGAGLPASLIRPDWAGWAPRLGFAYDVTGDGKTSLRGGAGVFNSLAELDYAAETRLSAPITEFLFGLDLCRFFGPGACGQSFAPPILTYPLAFTLGNQSPAAISSPPNIRNGYAYEWSLTFERELRPRTLLSLSLTGSVAHKLPRRALQNQGVPNLPGIRRGYHPQPGSNQFVRATDVNSNYNALVARLERRLSGGFSLVAGYTYGKSIDTASGLQGTNQPQDNYNRRAERGLSDFDLRQRFVFSGNWELPFGAKRRWLSEGLGAGIFGNWQMSGIVTLQGGQPLTAILPTALSGTQSNGTDRPDLVSNPNLPAGDRAPERWFNTAAFDSPPIYFDAQGPFSVPGSEGRNVITGPPFKVWDLSLERRVRMRENLGLVFRSDFFNLANHPNFDRPGLIFDTSNFGRISSAQNSRQVQFSLRLNW